MNIEELRDYCLSKKGATECFPFDEATLVFKVMGKIFAITGLERQPAAVNLKCDPERSAELREEYGGVITGAFHMNKLHWNTVELDQNIPIGLLRGLIDESYNLVVLKLTKKLKIELESL